MEVEAPRARLRRHAEVLAYVANDEDLFAELVRARGAGDAEAFTAAINQIPLPDSADIQGFCFRMSEELDKVHLIPVERLVWNNSGRPFDEVTARADLQAQKGAPPITDETWAAFVQWLVDHGVLRIETTDRPDPAYPTPVKCQEMCFGGILGPTPA